LRKSRTHHAIRGHPAVIAWADGLKSRTVHIPDGFLTNRVAFTMDALSAASILYAARRARPAASGRLVPLMGLLAAAALAGQMLNFPVIGGTSGHLLGGALLAILLGPMAAMIAMTMVVLAQALFLQDGGLVALGANIFNIAAVTTFSAYAAFRVMAGPGSSGKRLAAVSGIAAWVSVMAAAVSCSLMLVLSGAIPLRTGLASMAGYHALIGIAEGCLTAGAVILLARVRPDLFDAARGQPFSGLDWAYAVLFVALPFVVIGLGGGSALPDPLEQLLGGAGAPATASTQALVTPGRFIDYAVRAGLFVILIAGIFLAEVFARIRRREP
jgi:cobalt/nickel transport system permease protein